MHDERSCRVIQDDRCSGCSWHGRRLHTEGAPRRRRHADATRNWLCHWRRHRKLGPSADSALAPRSLSAAGPLRLPSPPSPPRRQSVGRGGGGSARATFSWLSAFHFLAPSAVAFPHSSPATPTTRLCDRAPHHSPLLSTLLLASPRLASPLDSFSASFSSTDAAGIADIPALRSRSSMDAGRVPRVPVGRCR